MPNTLHIDSLTGEERTILLTQPDELYAALRIGDETYHGQDTNDTIVEIDGTRVTHVSGMVKKELLEP